ncbi:MULTISPECIES: hypothetical protein [Dysgonomonas]|uniref:hypothetical protein n=1 Tax=Dysgonomonas TaxID=156973 RepID=UPI00092C5421|nr:MULTISPECIES: hypothetical protein [Dysgonomonas]MBS5908344.1 hypothetical protein [Dysgonomonas mossii]OJX58019.1 MAG: hypothetical protein BGO84_00075 [Dysgonomonas sp. 37-18]
MTTKEIPTEQLYSKIIEQASSVLKLSISQIKEKYTDYPLYLIDYIEKDIQEKSIEIRFHKEGITLTCTFDKDGNCDESFLFPDDAQIVEDFVSYLTDHHDYSFMKSRFMLGNCYLKIKELKEQRSDICLVFFQ